ncbi:hypothetical protein MXL46_14005 [Heyndrickxia sporothermodurans]|uniref:hypothetical protein n=1 Tax=Heyndrickxia sporothermodurans TaxID=46224 RepID=UPI002DB83D89|nr:hypothetical protein [Heyndrickxia sporothermodurans]MEB6550205.1 hypothetical protein [Heyndrickxia sporothermodurans]
MENKVTFQKGKTPRNELELPTLHFVVVDNWLETIGDKALISWLKMYSWCKRDEESEYNLWEQAKIPTSMNKIIKKLGVGRDTFYNKILKPLWNVGLIDIEEYEDSDNQGLKPMNIIVYKYPQNDINLKHQPIKEIRNYDTDYQSIAKQFTHKGGRPKKSDSNNIDEQIDNMLSNLEEKKIEKEHSSEIELGSSDIELGLSSTGTRVVPNENIGIFQSRTRGSSDIGHNNILNNTNNNFNSINKTLNNINNNHNNLDLNQYINDIKLPFALKKYFSVKVKDLVNDSFNIFEVEEFYNTNPFIVPDCDKEDYEHLNDIEFTRVVKKAFENAIRPIGSTSGLIKSWSNKALSFKKENLFDTFIEEYSEVQSNGYFFSELADKVNKKYSL